MKRLLARTVSSHYIFNRGLLLAFSVNSVFFHLEKSRGDLGVKLSAHAFLNFT